MIDSHCHLADDAFAGDVEEVVQRARASGVSTGLCVVACGDDAEGLRAAKVAALWPELRFAVGVHPHQAREFAGRETEVVPAVRLALSALPGACAVGEIGLDYHYDFSPREIQRDVFGRQVRFARETGLPIVVHTREADEDTIRIVADEGGGRVRGVFHCFSGGESLAREALGLGFALSFSGMVTFPRAASIRAVASAVPADRLLIESDSPYLAPVPLRGKRNEPAFVAHTAGALAELRGIGTGELDALVTANFRQLFGA